MINNISGSSFNEKIISELQIQSTQARQSLEKLNQSQAKDSKAEDVSEMRSNYRKSADSGTETKAAEGQNTIDSMIQKMRSLSNKAAAEGATLERTSADAQTDDAAVSQIREEFKKLSAGNSEQVNAALQSALSNSRDLSAPTANIKATGSDSAGSNLTDSGKKMRDVDMGNEMTDFSRFNAITQQGLAALSRANAGSNQASNAGTEATAAASNSQVSEAARAMASRATSEIESAVSKVQSSRATLGATQNRLESTIANLSNMESNLSAEDKKISDADIIASDMMNFSRNSILLNPGVAMLAQANSAPQQVLQLLGG